MRLLTPFLLVAFPAALLAQGPPYHADAALRTIQFVDENEGWAAGDDGVPGGGSTGVVLATADGGLEWKPVSVNGVPGLNVVKFFDERHGIAAGDGSDTFPSGLFQTADGGRTWKLVPGVRNPAWLAGDFSDPETGVLAGAWNRLAPVRDGDMGIADVDSLAGRNVTGLKLNGERAVAVGQGGLVMTSRDTAGIKWGFPDLQLPREVRAGLDFAAVAVKGSHIWAVGRPGSVVLHSADHGATWDVQMTGQPLPLHAVYFHDEARGWACGELGTILATTDGGKTWTVQRQGGLRSAILFVHTAAKGVPLDTVAALGGDDGYLAAAVGVTCPDPATLARRYDTDAERIAAAMKAADPLRATDPMRLATAMRLAGGAAGEVLWQFPVAGFQDGIDAAALLETWEKRHGEKAAVAMLRQLVLTLRIWRPEVIVTDAAADDTTRAIHTVLRKAFEVAADPDSFPEQIQVLGLQPWGGRKLLVTMDRADPTAVTADTMSPRARLGDSAMGYASTARRLWTDGADVPAFRLVATRMKDAEGHTKFFDGIALAPGGAARRDLPALTEKDAAEQAELQKALEKKRNVQVVIEGLAGGVANPDQALAHLGTAIADLPPSDAGKALYAAATAYARSGNWAMAREAYAMLVQKVPAHPLSVEATRWLVRFQSSSEARRRFELGQFAELTDVQVGAGAKDPDRVFKTPRTQVAVGPEAVITQTTHRQTLPGLVSGRKWYEAALEYETRLAAHGELFVRDVPTNLCWSAVRRQLGKAEESQRWLLQYITETTPPVSAPTGARGADPWRECVLFESWLLNRAGQPTPPKPVGACRRTTKRPYLDGKLDDACWAAATPLPLATTAGDLGAEFGCKEAIERQFKEKGDKPDSKAMREALADGSRAAFAFDDEYLYVAVVCRHPAGMTKDKLEKRSKDMDLRAFDRVSILIDLDRDYQTYYQLQVDQRGAVADDCWGDRTWDPKWFVAVHPDETGWTAEVAIPLGELTGEMVSPGKIWAVNVVRTVPGKGIQAWCGPAGVTPRPEGMGVVTFVGDRK